MKTIIEIINERLKLDKNAKLNTNKLKINYYNQKYIILAIFDYKEDEIIKEFRNNNIYILDVPPGSIHSENPHIMVLENNGILLHNVVKTFEKYNKPNGYKFLEFPKDYIDSLDIFAVQWQTDCIEYKNLKEIEI